MTSDTPSATSGPAAPRGEPIKDHVIREAVNQLRDCAVKFHATQQLRERIAGIIVPLLKSAHTAQPQEPVAWLDLSKMSASAMVYATGWKSNDKQSPLYAAPAPAPAVPQGWQITERHGGLIAVTSPDGVQWACVRGENRDERASKIGAHFYDLCKAMLAATPAAPSQEPVAEQETLVGLSLHGKELRNENIVYDGGPLDLTDCKLRSCFIEFSKAAARTVQFLAIAEQSQPGFLQPLFADAVRLTTPSLEPVTPDPGQWCQYVAGMIFCWLQMQEGLGLSDDDEDRFVKAIAGIIQRRLWAYKPSQEAVATTESKTSAS